MTAAGESRTIRVAWRQSATQRQCARETIAWCILSPIGGGKPRAPWLMAEVTTQERAARSPKEAEA